ncbi:hypothetical protein K3495_g16786 [Podosphaera aphanis]|nr:hypothetical protein K3495_g16786 [Podosphaera aphanis]
MQLDAMKEDERQRCFEEGRCYYCKDFGHLVKDCGSKKLADSRNSNRGRGRGGRGSLFTRGGPGVGSSRGRGNGFFKFRALSDESNDEEQGQGRFSPIDAENNANLSGKE